MNETIRGIVIRATDYKEKDKILDIFTPQGIVAVVAKGVRSSSAKLKALSSVLVYGEFSLQKGRNTVVLSGGEVTEAFFPCWTEPKRYATAMICFELAEKLFLKEDNLHKELVCLLKAIKEIAYGVAPLASCLWFAVKCAEKSGCDFSPVLRFDPTGYQLLLATVDCDEKGVIGASEADTFGALRALIACLTAELGVQIRTLREAERLFLTMSPSDD